MDNNMCVNVSILLKAVGSSNTAEVKKLLTSGFPTNALCGPMYITPLQLAAANPDPNVSLNLVKMLLEYGAKPDVLDRIGRSPLYHATICGHTNVVQELIENGANPNIRLLLGNKVSIDHPDGSDTKCLYINTDYKLPEMECLGRTPLHQAAKGGHLECVEVLLNAKANPNMQDVSGITPLLLAGAGIISSNKVAVQRYEAVVELLLNAGANPNWRNPVTNMSPLHHATVLCSERAVKALLEAGATVGLGGEIPEETALHTAAGTGYIPVVKLLLERGGKEFINSPDKAGCTPLHKAAYCGSRTCFSLLLANGGNLATQTLTGYSVMDAVFSFIPRPLNFLTELMDNSIKPNSSSVNDRDFKIHIDFSLLNPPGQDLQMAVVSAICASASDIQQMQIFQHPLLELFIRTKWSRLRCFFQGLAILQLSLVLSFSFYVVMRFHYDLEDKQLHAPRWMLVLSSTMLLFHALAQIALFPGHYLRESETWLNLACASIALIVSIVGEMNAHYMLSKPTPDMHLMAVGILIAWANLMMLVGRFPVWGYYALMFNAVLHNVVKVLLTFVCMIIGFALSFSVLFYESEYFRTPWSAIVKTTVMMMGEFEYGNMFRNITTIDSLSEQSAARRLRITSRIIFLLFVILTSIVLMNLMVGLAVSDIQALQTEGHVRRLLKQAEFVAHLERLTAHKIFKWKIVESRRSIPRHRVLQPVMGHLGLSPSLLESLVGLAIRNQQQNAANSSSVGNTNVAKSFEKSSESVCRNTVDESDLKDIMQMLQKILKEISYLQEQMQLPPIKTDRQPSKLFSTAVTEVQEAQGILRRLHRAKSAGLPV